MTSSSVLVRLTASVPGLGRTGSVAKVSFGYARNYLLPRRLAMLATGKRAMSELQRQQDHRVVVGANDHTLVRSIATSLGGRAVMLTAAANDDGRLFGAISANDVASALETDPIFRMEPIKQVGEHAATLDFGHDITANVTVVVKQPTVPTSRR